MPLRTTCTYSVDIKKLSEELRKANGSQENSGNEAAIHQKSWMFDAEVFLYKENGIKWEWSKIRTTHVLLIYLDLQYLSICFEENQNLNTNQFSLP